jgi:hypothetical protein
MSKKKKYFTCDACGNPIEKCSDFILHWKHDVLSNKSRDCQITHKACYCDKIRGNIITCEREWCELDEEEKVQAFELCFQRLKTTELESFLNCLRRLLNYGDIEL